MILTNYEICKNCKYYVPLYIKSSDRFKTLMGYCVYSNKMTRNRQKPFTDGEKCEYKKLSEETNCDTNESIKQTILKMQKQLTQILYILESNK